MKIKCADWKGEPAAYAQQKLDGWYCTLAGTGNGSVAVSSGDITLERFQAPPLPTGVIVVGELIAPFRPASSVPTAVKDGTARFYAHAVPTLDPNMPLETLEEHLTGWGLETVYYRRLEPGWAPEALLDEAIRLKWEGWVLKDGNLLNWRRIKVNRTADLIVTGWREGNKKNLGLLGSLRCSTFDGREVANVSGMDDATRIEMSEDPDTLIGRVVEVKYQYVGSKGRLRHPRFVRWRPDKVPSECKGDDL